MSKVFAFALNTQVCITCSGEQGTVIARSESVRSNDQYLLRYQNAEGRAVEEWWSEDAIEEAKESLGGADHMRTVTQDICHRCRTDCTPLANLSADDNQPPTSFICVGVNHPGSRTVPQDRFTLCWKNGAVDERVHWDSAICWAP